MGVGYLDAASCTFTGVLGDFCFRLSSFLFLHAGGQLSWVQHFGVFFSFSACPAISSRISPSSRCICTYPSTSYYTHFFFVSCLKCYIMGVFSKRCSCLVFKLFGYVSLCLRFNMETGGLGRWIWSGGEALLSISLVVYVLWQ